MLNTPTHLPTYPPTHLPTTLPQMAPWLVVCLLGPSLAEECRPRALGLMSHDIR